jgi:hypothetical protein
VRYAGTTTAGIPFNAMGWPITAKKRWLCDVCAMPIEPGDEYVKVQAGDPKPICMRCAPLVEVKR